MDVGGAGGERETGNEERNGAVWPREKRGCDVISYLKREKRGNELWRETGEEGQ